MLSSPLSAGPTSIALDTSARFALSSNSSGFPAGWRFIGPVTGEQRWQVYDGADVFVLPSVSENFGIVVTEAMARGVPVVVTDGVQASEHVRAAPALDGWFRGTSMHCPRPSMICLTPHKHARWASRAGGTFKHHLSWDRIAIALAEMYQNCLNRSPRKTPRCSYIEMTTMTPTP